jgi:hypothetical protein
VRILVVDADIVAARDVASMLGPEHQTHTAGATDAAMLTVCRCRPRLVLFKPHVTLILAQQMLTAMSELGDLKLVVHDCNLTREDLCRIVGAVL